jgi:hypothetical protein
MKSKRWILFLASVVAAFGIGAKPIQGAELTVSGQENLMTDENVQTEEMEVVEEEVATTDSTSGTCGDNVKWALTDEDGNGTYETMTISLIDSSKSDGAMNNETAYYYSWWDGFDVDNLVVESGVTELYGTGVLKIKTVQFPDTLKVIGKECFTSGTLTGNLVLPSSLEKIEYRAFYGCSLLTGTLSLPKGLQSIGAQAFLGCSGFTGQLILPSGLTEIGTATFMGCSGFTGDIIIPSTITEIPNALFSLCSGFDGEVVIPDSVVSIGESAFSGCKGLKDLNLPSHLKKIGAFAFDFCDGLTGNLIIPDSVTEIGESAFFECTGLTGELIIPSGVTRIGPCAFCGCNGITKAYIPKSVKMLGDATFSQCENLKEVEFESGFAGVIFTQKTDYSTGVGVVSDVVVDPAEEAVVELCFKLEKVINPSSVSINLPIGNWVKQGAAGTKITAIKNGTAINIKTGWVTDNGKTYYYNSNGTLLKDKWVTGTDGQIRYVNKQGIMVTNEFAFDGSYTYYLQADGSPMKDRLTYHPDGEHIIYFDSDGHEVFQNFQYCPSVGYTCYFDSQGYIYKDQITFVGDKVYYLDENGRMKQNEWFSFANGRDVGYAEADGTLRSNGFGYDPWGRVVFYHWNGMVARGLISDGAYYYSMDTTDGHYLGQFPVQ